MPQTKLLPSDVHAGLRLIKPHPIGIDCQFLQYRLHRGATLEIILDSLNFQVVSMPATEELSSTEVDMQLDEIVSLAKKGEIKLKNRHIYVITAAEITPPFIVFHNVVQNTPAFFPPNKLVTFSARSTFMGEIQFWESFVAHLNEAIQIRGQFVPFKINEIAELLTQHQNAYALQANNRKLNV